MKSPRLVQRVFGALAAARRGATLPIDRPNASPFLINLGLNNLDTAPIQTKSDQIDSYVGWVSACVGKLSEDARANERAIWRKVGTRREDWEEIPWATLPEVFKRPNAVPNQNTWGKLIELRNIHKEMTGEAWWHLVTATPGGRVIGIELIQPDAVGEPIFNDNHTEVKAWWVNVGTVAGGRKPIPSEDLVLDFYPNPRDPLRGASKIESFALAHHMDIYLRAYGVKLIRDGAMIGQYIGVKERLSDEESLAVESRLNRRYRTPGRIPVFGNEARIESVPIPLNDLNFLRLLRPSRDMILAVFGIPASMLGLTEGAGDTNQKVSEKAYKKNALHRRLITFDEVVNDVIIPRVFGADAANLFYESQNPVESDAEWEFERAVRKLEAGASTVNRFLREIGDEDIGDEGNVYFVKSNVRIVSSLVAVSETGPPEEKPEPESTPDDERSLNSIDDSVGRISAALASAVHRSEEDAMRVRRDVAAESFLRIQDKEERTLKSDVRRIFSREQRELTNRLKENEDQLQRSTSWPSTDRFGELVAYASDDRSDDGLAWLRDWVDDAVEAITEEWNRAMVGATLRSTRSGWNLLHQEVAGSLSFKVFERKAAEFARRTAGRKIQQIQTATLVKVRRVIRSGVEDGLSINEISSNLERLYDGFKGARAEVIARTETANSINFGKFSAAKESRRRLGMDIKRNWVATSDDRTRETHAAADSSVNEANRDLDMETPYSVGAATLWHPGDPAGPPDETIQCRCVEFFRDAAFDRSINPSVIEKVEKLTKRELVPAAGNGRR